MLSVTDAAARTRALCSRLPSEDVAVDEADGRVLAAPALARRPLPGCDSSAMDGFAARAGELPGRLPVVGQVAAGHPPPALAAGTAVRIMTGAPLPVGADTVVMFEDARDERAWVELPASPAGSNVRRTGEDLAVGDLVVDAGVRLGWGEIAALAALGEARIAVARRPRVAIIATGDELVALGTAPAPHQVVDSSAHALRVMVADAGGVATHLGIARDTEAEVQALVARALTFDVVLTTGGVSAGDHDHVRGALAAAGVALDFWKVAMKPGKPLAAGTAGATVVFALPGNPVSSLVAFELFVRPALLAMQGAAVVDRPRALVIVEGDHHKAPGRAHFLRARVRRDGARLIATPLARQGSHMLSSLVGVDALVELEAAGEGVTAGATASAILLRAV